MVTISGGIISKQSGSSITYKPKCDKCNEVEFDETTVTITRGVTEVSTKKCSSCGNVQITKIKDVVEKQKNSTDTTVLIEMDNK